MNIADRIDKLGNGIFHRNDFHKIQYQQNFSINNLPALIDLSLGSTDLPPPKSVLDVINESLYESNSSSYSLYSSTSPFREVVSSWAKQRLCVDVDPDKEVLLLIGSQDGTSHMPLASINPGDSALILDPSYPSHRGGLILADADIQKITLKQKKDWRPDFNCLTTSQLEEIKMMIFGFPHNPTAQVGEQSWLEEAMHYSKRNNIIFVHDNPYLDLVIEGEAPSLLRCQGWKEHGIEFFSLSKSWCMGGQRIGFAIGAEPLLSGLRKVKGVVDFNQFLPIQKGAIEALSNCYDWPGRVTSIYKERRDRAVLLLNNFGWEVPVPKMAMYLWLPLPKWAKDKGMDDESFTLDLLRKKGVALTPGSGFGLGGANWVRMALVQPLSIIDEALGRIESWWNENT